MSKVYSGSILGVRELTEAQRAETRAELTWLEKDLVRRRKKLAYWTARKQQAETLPHISDKLRRDTLYFYEQSVRLIQTGERLRAYLVAELQEQPEHQDAYYLAH